MNIFKRIYLSVSRPAYYQDLLKASGASAAGYYTKLALLAALVALIIFFWSSGAADFLTQPAGMPLVDQAIDYYPAELVLTWDQGKLTSNVAEPFFFPVPAAWQAGADSSLPSSSADDQMSNLVVIDTQQSITPEQFAAYQTLAWLGREQLMVLGENGRTQIIPYGPQTNFVLSSALVEQFGAYAKTFLKYLRFAFLPLFYVAFLFYFVGKLIYLLLAALLIWLILYLKKVPGAGYGTAYKVGLHVLTLPILVEGGIALLSDYSLPTGVFSLLLLIMTLVMFPNQNPTVAVTPNQS